MSIEETAKDLVEALKGKPVPAPYDTSATVVRVEDDTLWVHIPGGVEETPVRKTVNASAGDEIQIRVGGGRAWAVGNATAPPTDDTRANAAMEEIVRINRLKADKAEIGEAVINTLVSNDITAKNLTVIDDDGNVVATYSGHVVIGKDGETHLEIDFNSLKLIDKDGNTYFHVSDLRDNTGYMNVVDYFTGSGTNHYFTFNYTCSSVDSVTINDAVVSPSDYTYNSGQIVFNTAPASGASIAVFYKTDSQMAKAFTIGTRGNGVIGPYSYVEGLRAIASGKVSHAEGTETIASGRVSHAEGVESEASGFCSHVEGFATTASGDVSHAEGTDTIARGPNSHAEGTGTIASGSNQHAAGRNNIEDYTNTYVEIIGNGSSNNARSNARTLDWNGNEVLSGNLTINGSTDVGAILAALTADTGWVDLNPVFYRKFGNMVCVSCHAQFSSALASRTWTTIATLPDGVRPSRRIDAACALGANAEIVGSVRIQSNGKIDVYPSAAVSSPYIAFSVAFPV